ncbi:hypothetical protein TAMC210_01340 [Thermanaeromonas sp. C210]|nr:hypothetical protein TAMC210_01340 [Thermanaeromonas sp. C210]
MPAEVFKPSLEGRSKGPKALRELKGEEENFGCPAGKVFIKLRREVKDKIGRLYNLLK